MKTKIILCYVLTALLFPIVSGQRVSFGYDAAGNRVQSKTIVMSRSVVPQEEPQEKEPETDIETTDKDKEKKHEKQPGENPLIFSEVLQEMKVYIYPNPTKGLLKVDVQNVPEKQIVRIALYNLSGKLVFLRSSEVLPIELDITNQDNGMYILNIQVGEHRSEWKVIKQ